MNSTKELRIGNLVLFEGEVLPVCSLHSDNTLRLQKGEKSIGCFGVHDVEPITLYPEMLEKCGFENIGKNVLVKKGIKEFKIGVDDMGGANWLFYMDSHLSLHSMRYLHQLQNLYFALTGEELEVNL